MDLEELWRIAPVLFENIRTRIREKKVPTNDVSKEVRDTRYGSISAQGGEEAGDGSVQKEAPYLGGYSFGKKDRVLPISS